LLFIKTKVAERALRKGSRLAAKKKQKLKDKLKGLGEQKKRKKQKAKTIAVKALRELRAGAPNSKDNKPKSKLCLMYNLV
jgi:hypothetical protein